MNKVYSILIRILIFITLVVITYAFFGKSANPFSSENKVNDIKFETFFKYQDSILINGNFKMENNKITLSGNLKSICPLKIKAIELIFQQFDKLNNKVGQETLLINKELGNNEKITFTKDGFTLDKNTEYLIITPRAIK